MAIAHEVILHLLLFVCLLESSMAARRLSSLVQTEPLTLAYHNGALLSGRVSVNLIWYGCFSPAQRAVLSDLVDSLAVGAGGGLIHENGPPSVSMWWKTTEKYRTSHRIPRLELVAGEQIVDDEYSLGKSLTEAQIVRLAARGGEDYAVNVVLTSEDVAVEGFCRSRCGTHGWSRVDGSRGKFAYLWVGDSVTQCPGMCAWPFHQPIYGPQTPPLLAPNNDVGVDGMVINVAALLAGAATNPFGNGYFQGPSTAPLEAATACPGIYGSGAYPGYAGNLLVDATTGGSYNAVGASGRKYLLPALWDPSTSSCSTLV